MGKTDTKKKNPIRRYKRAQLVFPTHIVRRQLKAKMPHRRFQKEVEILITALVEHSVERLLLNAAEKITSGSHINSQHLHSAINDKNSEVYGVFPKGIPGVF
jgi:histone H3/H4